MRQELATKSIEVVELETKVNKRRAAAWREAKAKHKRRKGGLHLNGQQSGVRPQQWRDLNTYMTGHNYEAALGHRPTKAVQLRLAAGASERAAGGVSMGRGLA